MKELKTESLNLRITMAEKDLLNCFGGQAKGFEKIVNFYLENYDMTKVYEKKIKREKSLKKIKRKNRNRMVEK